MTSTSSTQYAIGIDVGGTKIAGGLVVGDSGRIVQSETIPTRSERGGAAVLDDCVALIERLYNAAIAAQRPVSGIGLGVCELVDRTGRVTSAYNFDWRDLPVPARCGEVCGELAAVVMESDVRAAARAEARYGAGNPYDLFAYVTVGTGISSALVQAGEPLVGARGNALVLATMPLTTTCTTCGTVLHPVLEEFASGPAMVRRYNEGAQTAVANGPALFAAVDGGDPLATDVVRSAGEALGVSVAFLCNVIDPAAVVVGGGVGVAGGLYWQAFVEATRTHIYAEDTRQLPILPADLGAEAGVIGAAATVLPPLVETSV